jgi:hypothetical protein
MPTVVIRLEDVGQFGAADLPRLQQPLVVDGRDVRSITTPPAL